MRCVEEQPPNPAAPLSRLPGVWHATTSRATSDFAPIRCSKDEGIVFHGGVVDREPTCPDCIRIVGAAAVPEEATT